MQTAILKVTLPPAMPQHVKHAHRVVNVTGSVADGDTVYPVAFVGPILVTCDASGVVTVSVTETLANGKQSKPSVVTITPHSLVEAKAADETLFQVELAHMDHYVEPLVDGTP